MPMVIVGALVRALKEDSLKVQSALAKLPGAMVQGFEDPTKIGLVIEAEGLNEAHRILKDQVPQMEGVLTVYTVHANFESLALARSAVESVD